MFCHQRAVEHKRMRVLIVHCSDAFSCSFEKMISGMYLGDIVRLVLKKLTEDNLLFKGKVSDALHTAGKFETKLISDIEK